MEHYRPNNYRLRLAPPSLLDHAGVCGFGGQKAAHLFNTLGAKNCLYGHLSDVCKEKRAPQTNSQGRESAHLLHPGVRLFQLLHLPNGSHHTLPSTVRLGRRRWRWRLLHCFLLRCFRHFYRLLRFYSSARNQARGPPAVPARPF